MNAEHDPQAGPDGGYNQSRNKINCECKCPNHFCSVSRELHLVIIYNRVFELPLLFSLAAGDFRLYQPPDGLSVP